MKFSYAFDNSQNHHARPPDALWINKLKSNMRPTEVIDTLTGETKEQTFLTADRKIKGMKTILTERGLYQQVLLVKGKRLLKCKE